MRSIPLKLRRIPNELLDVSLCESINTDKIATKIGLKPITSEASEAAVFCIPYMYPIWYRKTDVNAIITKAFQSVALGDTFPSYIHIHAKRIGTAKEYLKNMTVNGRSNKSVARSLPTGHAIPQRTETINIIKLLTASLRVLKSSIIIRLS